jgi:uncharacterized protein involved in outer membrane biogenesis
MKKMLKLVIVVAVLVVAAGVGLMLFLDRGVKRAVEVVGPRLTQVDVRLDNVNVSLLSGRVELEGLFVGNPEGYKSESAIEIGSLVLAARPGSFLSDKLVIRKFDLQGPVITFEGGLKENNLRKILDNVNTGLEAERTSEDGDRDESDEGSRKLQVDELVVSGGKVRVLMNVLGDRGTTIDLPEIRMSNLGSGPEGITTEELTDRLLRVIIEKATIAAASAVAGSPDGLTEGLKRAGQEAADKALNEAARGVADFLKKKE